jgi:hypothetical protein
LVSTFTILVCLSLSFFIFVTTLYWYFESSLTHLHPFHVSFKHLLRESNIRSTIKIERQEFIFFLFLLVVASLFIFVSFLLHISHPYRLFYIFHILNMWCYNEPIDSRIKLAIFFYYILLYLIKGMLVFFFFFYVLSTLYQFFFLFDLMKIHSRFFTYYIKIIMTFTQKEK